MWGVQPFHEEAQDEHGRNDDEKEACLLQGRLRQEKMIPWIAVVIVCASRDAVTCTAITSPYTYPTQELCLAETTEVLENLFAQGLLVTGKCSQVNLGEAV